MTELTNEHGIVCVRLDLFQEDGEAWAIVASWKKGVDGVPDKSAWSEAIESSIAECEKNGAIFIDSRVITACAGVDEALAAARAAIHRDSLTARGFKQGEGRVEYRMDLEEALAVLEAGKTTSKLAWSCVDGDNETELARAAGILLQASEADPASHPDDDSLGFLKVLLEEEGTTAVPERIQIGMCEGVPAAILALRSYPCDGWSTIHYLGVLPAFRGRGIGAETMLHAVHCLKAMGGRIYQDGTGSNNAAARSLFARLGRPPFRVMEEWRLEKRIGPQQRSG